MPFRPNTFLDLVFMANAQPTGGTENYTVTEEADIWVDVYGSYRSDPTFYEYGSLASTFSSGRHFEAQRNGTYPLEASDGSATFRSGNHYFTLIDYGDLTDTEAVAGASFSSGTHAYILIIDGSNAPRDDGLAEASFDNGTHRYILNIYGSEVESGTNAVAFNAGTLTHVGSGDGKDGGYIVRFSATNGDTVLSVEYTEYALLNGHTFDYLLGVYTLGNVTGTDLPIDPPFYGDSVDDRYQILTTPPPPPPPPTPPSPGTGSLNYDVESVANGTGAVVSASFYNGTYFLFGTHIYPDYEQSPTSVSFLNGTYQFFLIVSGVEDNGTSVTSFYDGTHRQILVSAGTNLTDDGTATVTFQTGRTTVGVPTYDASITVVTADTGTLTTDTLYVSFDQTAQTGDQSIMTMDQET